GVVSYNPETTDGNGGGGKLGSLSNAEALALVEELFDDWKNVTMDGFSTVDLSMTQAEGLGDVNETNIDDHFTYCPPDSFCLTEGFPFNLGSARSGQSPIIFDEEGNLTDLIQGTGASDDILGFAGPRVVERTNGVLYITESQAILNGKFIDCPEGAASNDSCQSPEVTVEEFKGAIFHELGHFLGLDHVQVNLSSASAVLAGDSSKAENIPTMLPIFIDGQAQLTPHYDDQVAVSMLYPTVDFDNNFCVIQGKIFEVDGVTELQGVNVIARNESNPTVEAVSFVSGAYYTGDFSDCDAQQGNYFLYGIRPGETYSVGIEKISQSFRGGSSIEPCDPAAKGVDAKTLSGSFSCSVGGQTITAGSSGDTNVVTTKEVSAGTTVTTSGSGGGCTLIP
ncbi:MAG: hypothetical protein Q7S00_00170, partial [bacterium]|nr:hypothetical protein [bacterium]